MTTVAESTKALVSGLRGRVLPRWRAVASGGPGRRPWLGPSWCQVVRLLPTRAIARYVAQQRQVPVPKIIIPHSRAENRETADMVLAAQLGDLFAVFGDDRLHGAALLSLCKV